MLSGDLFLAMVVISQIGTGPMRRFVPGPNWGNCEEDFMSDAVNFAEINGQHVELLPARTVMSMFVIRGGGDGGRGGAGGKGTGGIGLNVLNIDVLGDQTNSAADGIGGPGGSANGGRG
jgi:hypothetical protein